MWINDKVTYTPEIVAVTKGQPQQATVKAIGIDGTVTLTLADGTEERVEARLCERATGEKRK